MRVAELLQTSILSKAEVIAGHAGLTTHDVLSVNIMDAPDIITFLKKGDLLLTNGYLLKDRPDAFVDFITSMHRKGCAGLAIKTKRFAMSMPQEVLDEANRLHFPIVELSMIEATLGEVFQQSISIILENKNDELHYALNIHKQFTGMILQGDGMERIVQALADILAAPVLMFNLKGQIVAASAHFSNPDMDQLKHGSFEAIRSLPPDTAESPVSLCFINAHTARYRHAELFPIHTYRHEGYLLSFHDEHPLSGPNALAFEQAAHVIGLELTKKHAVKERSRRYKNEFFSDLIDGYLGSEQEVLHRGAKYGLTAGGKAHLILVRKDALQHAQAGEQGKEERLGADRDAQYEMIKREIAALGVRFVMFTKNDLFGIVVFRDNAAWDEAAIVEELEAAAGTIFEAEQISFSFGIGNAFTNVLDLGLSYKEALMALQSGFRMNRERFVLSYQSMDVSRLLRMLPYEELERFYMEAFKELLLKADQEPGELLRTLKVYYEHHCSIMDTAKALYVHRNTVIYRLEKCEKLLGRRLKDADVSFRLQVAFAIAPLLKNDKSS